MINPYILIVSIWLKNNDIAAFEAFESQAAKAMAPFGGQIERVIRIAQTQPDDNKPFEVHIVSFPSEAAFQAYRQSPEAKKLAETRERLVAKTVILAGSEMTAYT